MSILCHPHCCFSAARLPNKAHQQSKNLSAIVAHEREEEEEEERDLASSTLLKVDTFTLLKVDTFACGSFSTFFAIFSGLRPT